MDEPQYTAFVDFEHDNSKPLDEEFEKNLRYGGYVVDDDVDELDEIKFRMYSGRFSTKFLGLTIAPTSDCNFRCAYCYEKDSIKYPIMSKSTQEKVIDLVKSKANALETFFVTWYGGEPLLAIDSVDNLSKNFLEICNENNIFYSAGMITNGYLLTRHVLEKLNSLKVNSLQITLDGSREQHNKRRPLHNGMGTFDTIIENLKEAQNLFEGEIIIRVNVDKTNVHDADNVMDILFQHGLSNKVVPSLGKVVNSNNCYNASLCFDTPEFLSIDSNFRAKYGLPKLYPLLKRNFCGADALNSFVINADGLLYKCWNDIGISERSVGNIIEDTICDKMFHNYLLYDPTEDSVCRACKYLPVCMGGCPNRRLLSQDERCEGVKYVIKNYILSLSKEI